MGKIILPDKAKLFIGIIGIDQYVILEIREKLIQAWQEIDSESDFFEFDYTSYYQKEMGDCLIKKFYSFTRLISREEIVTIKIKTNNLEEQLRKKSKRQGRNINLDPGYLTLSNIVLATTKDYNHRIYINKGIFLENTLNYSSKTKSYMENDWTYPDYRSQAYKAYFNNLREIYKKQLTYGEKFEREF